VDLLAEIADLQTAFQHIADRHDWIRLAVPPPGEQFCVLRTGEKEPGPIILSLGLTGVVTPRDMARRAIVDHVNQLTEKAVRLLNRALEQETRIPADCQQTIREAEQRMPGGYGWVSFLRFAVPTQHLFRYEHYPQVAATALLALRDWCSPRSQTAPTERWLPASEAVNLAEAKGHPITLKWLTQDASKHGVRTRPRQLPGKHKVEVEWGSLAGYLLRPLEQNRNPDEEEGCGQEEAAQRIREAKEQKRKNRSLD
jgi:hypothetical protein